MRASLGSNPSTTYSTLRPPLSLLLLFFLLASSWMNHPLGPHRLLVIKDHLRVIFRTTELDETHTLSRFLGDDAHSSFLFILLTIVLYLRSTLIFSR